MAGVTCTHCGASTPLPDDLRVPSFVCQFCAGELATIDYAGEGAVRVEEMKAFFQRIVEDPGSAKTATAPKLVQGEAGAREAKCLHCGAAISVPLTITVPVVRCEACGRTEHVTRYVSDAERLQTGMARQIAGNQALAELVRTGLRCSKCGAHNALADAGTVQMSCTSCGHVILVADFVPSDAIDRARLKRGVQELREGLQGKQRERERVTRFVVIGVIAIVIVIFVGAMLMFGRTL